MMRMRFLLFALLPISAMLAGPSEAAAPASTTGTLTPPGTPPATSAPALARAKKHAVKRASAKSRTAKPRVAKHAVAKAAAPTAAAAAVAAPAAAAAAISPGAAQTLGTADGWTAYMSRDKAGRVCYVFGEPQKGDPGIRRKQPVAMVTHRPEENIANVVSFVEGYALKDGSNVLLDVGGAKFDLFTKDDSAWARTPELDKAIVAALAKAKQAVVKGTPQNGRPTSDVYPLAGFAKALALIDKACGVKR